MTLAEYGDAGVGPVRGPRARLQGEPSSPFERRARLASRRRLGGTPTEPPWGIGGSSEPGPERVTATGEPCRRALPARPRASHRADPGVTVFRETH
jgi:hypothetical protein